jgi:hypothetical protein
MEFQKKMPAPLWVALSCKIEFPVAILLTMRTDFASFPLNVLATG